MTPTSFAFTLTMPGDERFVGAIRQLAAQAASYAQLPAEAGEVLAGHVEQADAGGDCRHAGRHEPAASTSRSRATTPASPSQISLRPPRPAAAAGLIAVDAGVTRELDGGRVAPDLPHPAANPRLIVTMRLFNTLTRQEEEFAPLRIRPCACTRAA